MADIVARVGGDEFSVILPETSAKTSQKFCNRVQNQIEEFNQKSNLSEPINISLGYSTMKDENQDLNQVFDKADQQMYEKKGRRRKQLS